MPPVAAPGIDARRSSASDATPAQARALRSPPLEFRQRMVHFVLLFAARRARRRRARRRQGAASKPEGAPRSIARSSRRSNALRRENSRLREDVRRLNEDPGAIEAIARQELGLVRRGEVLFIIARRQAV